MKDKIKDKPFYSIYRDLCSHPTLTKNLEFTAFLADFIYQLGYKKLHLFSADVPVLSESDTRIAVINVETDRRLQNLVNDTEGNFKPEDEMAIIADSEMAKREAQRDDTAMRKELQCQKRIEGILNYPREYCPDIKTGKHIMKVWFPLEAFEALKEKEVI